MFFLALLYVLITRKVAFFKNAILWYFIANAVDPKLDTADHIDYQAGYTQKNSHAVLLSSAALSKRSESSRNKLLIHH